MMDLQDELQFRRKEKPINICVDLYPGGTRKITVNSGYPLTDVVAAICKEVGKFTEEFINANATDFLNIKF